MIYSCLGSIAFLSILSAVTPEKRIVSVLNETDFSDIKTEEINSTNTEGECIQCDNLSTTADAPINLLHTIGSTTSMVFHNPCNIPTSRAQESVLIHVHLTSVTDENPNPPKNDNEFEGKRCLLIDEAYPSHANKYWDAQPPLETGFSAKKRLPPHRHGCFKFLHRSYADCSGDLIE